MQNRNRNRKADPKSTIISLVLLVLFLLPGEITAILIVLSLIAVPIYLIVKKSAKKSDIQRTPSRSKSDFDDCPSPKPFCFHKDKGEHHVVRGKEIDPWDRPDIDISKYQRK